MHHAPSTIAGATNPRTNAVCLGIVERIENRLLLRFDIRFWIGNGEAGQAALRDLQFTSKLKGCEPGKMPAQRSIWSCDRPCPSRLFTTLSARCQNHLDIGAPVLLTTGLGCIFSNWIA